MLRILYRNVLAYCLFLCESSHSKNNSFPIALILNVIAFIQRHLVGTQNCENKLRIFPKKDLRDHLTYTMINRLRQQLVLREQELDVKTSCSVSLYICMCIDYPPI